VGSLLTRTLGTWTGYPTPSKSTKWQREAATDVWADIASATGSTYVPVSADIGHRVRALVTATNATGSASTGSTPTSAVVDAPAVIDPATLSPVAWVEGDDLGASASLITTWTDKSGNGNSPTESTNKPVVALVNGKKVASFDGTNDHLGKTLVGGALSQPYEVWQVSRMRSGSTATHKGFYVDNDGSTAKASWVGNDPGVINLDGGSAFQSSDTALPETWQVRRFVVNGASSKIEFDGVSIGTGDAGSGTLNGINLGGGPTGAYPADIDIRAHFVCPALSAGDATDLLDYLTLLLP
jgi:hypothetical protein